MRWVRWSRQAKKDAARAAALRRRSSEQLTETRAQVADARQLADSMRESGAHNGFSEAMELLYYGDSA
jgi:hypothetical protein